MKKICLFSICLLGLLICCGCNNKEIEKEVDPDIVSSYAEISSYLETNIRETKDFEKLEDTLEATKNDNGYYYRIMYYFEDDKLVNSTTDIICPNEEEATELFTAIYNNENTEEAVMLGKYISYDYKEGKCDFFGIEQDEVASSQAFNGYSVIRDDYSELPSNG